MIARRHLEDIYEDLKRSFKRSFTTFFGRLRYRPAFCNVVRNLKDHCYVLKATIDEVPINIL